MEAPFKGVRWRLCEGLLGGYVKGVFDHSSRNQADEKEHCRGPDSTKKHRSPARDTGVFVRNRIVTPEAACGKGQLMVSTDVIALKVSAAPVSPIFVSLIYIPGS